MADLPPVPDETVQRTLMADLPPVPDETVQEGSRWRWHAPTPEQVRDWFLTQPLDEGMEHKDYVSGVVIIPQRVKVKHQVGDEIVDRYEMTYTPYVQIGTRVGYMRRLAEHRGLIYHPSPVKVPRSLEPRSPYFNGNMPDGLWWHVVQSGAESLRYLCATWEVGLYEPQSYAAKLRGDDAMPLVRGVGTKQVGGGPDDNGLMKAETGAIGRALGVAGILVVGTGIASAEDVQESVGYAGTTVAATSLPPELPGAPAGTESNDIDALRASVQSLHAQLQERNAPLAAEFDAFYKERARSEGWEGLTDVPPEVLRGLTVRLQTALDAPVPVPAVPA